MPSEFLKRFLFIDILYKIRLGMNAGEEVHVRGLFHREQVYTNSTLAFHDCTTGARAGVQTMRDYE